MTKQETSDFGALLKCWREHKGISQVVLADKAGVSRQIIQAYEAASGRKHSPTLSMLEKLAGAMGVSVQQFLSGPGVTVIIGEEGPSCAEETTIRVPALVSIPKNGDQPKVKEKIPVTRFLYDYSGVTNDAAVLIKSPTDEMYPLIRQDLWMLIDTSQAKPRSQDVVIGRYRGRVLVRRYVVRERAPVLVASNANCPDIEVEDPNDLYVFGTVKLVIHKM